MNDQIVIELQDLFVSRKITLSVAESCTGGHLAARLTRQPGCSIYFLGGVVAYSNLCKIKFLGVDPDLLSQNGAVSCGVVQQMAKGVMRALGSDYSIAVSGIAGPDGGTESKPVGTIWTSIAKKEGEIDSWMLQLTGSREEIIYTCVEKLIERLYERLKKD